MSDDPIAGLFARAADDLRAIERGAAEAVGQLCSLGLHPPTLVCPHRLTFIDERCPLCGPSGGDR